MTARIETPSTLASLFPSQLGRALDLEKGDPVLATGDQTRGLFRVEAGFVRLVRHAVDGREVTLHVARPGDFFAEASFLSEIDHCDAVAEQTSEILAFAKEHVLGRIHQNRHHAFAWIEHFSKQVQSLRAQTARLSLETAEDRVLAFLRLRNRNDEMVPIDRPWKAVASEFGLSHEALHRALVQLEKRGVIRRDRAGVELIAHPSR